MSRWQDSREFHELLIKEEKKKSGLPNDTWHLESPRVEAYTYCGCCGVIDFHLMRAPIVREETTWGRELRHSLFGYGMFEDDAIKREKRRRRDALEYSEGLYEVIRTCVNCQHEWGQK